jgi:hypothetical protein
MASVEPASDPPRGSAASMSASLLGGGGLEDGFSGPAPSDLAGPDVIHQIKKVATPMMAAMANAA